MTRVILAVTQKTAKCMALLISGGLLILNLTGCSGSSWLDLGGGDTAQPLAAPAAAQPDTPPVAFGQIFGAPAAVTAKFNDSLAAAGKEQNVRVAAAAGEAEYTVKGYLIAAAESKGTRLNYKWDITDKAGKRVKRIEGAEIAAGKKPGDPWSAVDDAAIQTVSNKTMAALRDWLTNPTPAATPVASARPARNPANTAVMTPAHPPAVAMPKGEAVVAVIPVSGAPGDGQSALADAMKKHLADKGIKVSDTKMPGAYAVKGTVVMGAAEGGQQPITIRWVVLDPSGRQMGNAVVQKNRVEQGSLDGAWGQVADIAAGAAAVELAKIAPKPST